jgi:16S rRNA (guanine527-N7)-methyltransferase
MHQKNILENGLNELGFSCSSDQITAFEIYLSELKKWNRSYNLTALKTDHDIIVKHFLDSLLYTRALPKGKIRLADAGTGAGFPGIPLKIVMPQLDLTLIESSRKKCSFLRHIVRALHLSEINIIEERLEQLGMECETEFDVMVSRAAFSIADFMNSACPYIKDGGRLIISKGPAVVDELKDLQSPNNYKMLKLQLPYADAERNLVILKCSKM